MSSYLDLSFVYGDSLTTANSKRTFTNGEIITTTLDFNTTEEFIAAIYGSDEILYLYDDSNFSTYDPDSNKKQLFNNIAELNIPSFDYNINENTISNITQCPLSRYASINSGKLNNIPLASLHTLFALEHNRIANELSQEYPSWDDETLFYESRQLNIAVFQHIVYNEYIPILLAKNFNNMDLSYNSSIDATASNFFCTVGLKYGHAGTPTTWAFGGYREEVSDNNDSSSSSTHTEARYGGKANDVVASVALRDTFVRPCFNLQEVGNDNYLASTIAGMLLTTEARITPKYCEEVRSFLGFAALGRTAKDVPYWDLLAVDLLRLVFSIIFNVDRCVLFCFVLFLSGSFLCVLCKDD